MKNFHFNLSDDDVKAICYALEIIPAYDFFENDTEADISFSLASSAGQKLILHKQLTNRETVFVALAIDCAFKALRNEMSLDDKELTGLRPYFFTINKLHPAFAPLLNEDSV